MLNGVYCLFILILLTIFDDKLYTTCLKSIKNEYMSLSEGKNETSLVGKINKLTDSKIIKSNIDDRKYYSFTLDNGLKTFVINDSNTKTESAGVTVGAGGLMDKEICGLAHFTEHMLFLGSRKYNNATYFVDYITLHHGAHNGKTKSLNTFFFFKIDKDYFPKGFDVFSRFFMDPTFNETFIEKEVNSVHSEYEKNLQVDGLKKKQIFKSLSSNQSFLNHWYSGNNKTILEYARKKNLNLTNIVREYYNKYYVPNNMQLVIYGSRPIDYYMKLVNNTFGKLNKSEVINQNKLIEKEKPFELHKQGYIALYQTIKDHKDIDISFILPHELTRDINTNSVYLYFQFLINRSYENFRKYGYITNIKSKLKNFYPNFNVFKIKATLTEKGLRELDELIKILFDYIEFLKNNAVENKKLFHLIKQHYDNKFFNRTYISNIKRYMKTITGDISDHPIKNVLSHNQLITKYDKKLLDEFSSYLTLNNTIILIGNKHFDINNNTNSEKNIFSHYSEFLNNFNMSNILYDNEKFLKTPYGRYKINIPHILQNNSHANTPFNLVELSYFTKGKKKNLKLCKDKKCKKDLIKDEKDLLPLYSSENNSNIEVWYKG